MNHPLVLSLHTHFSEWGDKRKKSFQEAEKEAVVIR